MNSPPRGRLGSARVRRFSLAAAAQAFLVGRPSVASACRTAGCGGVLPHAFLRARAGARGRVDPEADLPRGARVLLKAPDRARHCRRPARWTARCPRSPVACHAADEYRLRLTSTRRPTGAGCRSRQARENYPPSCWRLPGRNSSKARLAAGEVPEGPVRGGGFRPVRGGCAAASRTWHMPGAPRAPARRRRPTRAASGTRARPARARAGSEAAADRLRKGENVLPCEVRRRRCTRWCTCAAGVVRWHNSSWPHVQISCLELRGPGVPSMLRRPPACRCGRRPQHQVHDTEWPSRAKPGAVRRSAHQRHLRRAVVVGTDKELRASSCRPDLKSDSGAVIPPPRCGPCPKSPSLASSPPPSAAAARPQQPHGRAFISLERHACQRRRCPRPARQAAWRDQRFEQLPPSGRRPRTVPRAAARRPGFRRVPPAAAAACIAAR